MNDPDQACRLTEERITKLEKDKAQAERLAEESRMNKEKHFSICTPGAIQLGRSIRILNRASED